MYKTIMHFFQIQTLIRKIILPHEINYKHKQWMIFNYVVINIEKESENKMNK